MNSLRKNIILLSAFGGEDNNNMVIFIDLRNIFMKALRLRSSFNTEKRLIPTAYFLIIQNKPYVTTLHAIPLLYFLILFSFLLHHNIAVYYSYYTWYVGFYFFLHHLILRRQKNKKKRNLELFTIRIRSNYNLIKINDYRSERHEVFI